jgi:hypothetical protein
VTIVYAPTNGCVDLPITACAADIIFVAGGAFRTGSDKHSPEGSPVHRGYVTVAEIASGASPENNRKRTRHEQG